MAELTSELLPILQLDDVVVLPGMTATVAVESDPQRAALTAAQNGNRLILLVPRVGGRFTAIGTVAQVVESGQLPSGAEVSILKGLHRARLGGGQSDIGGALWVQVEPLPDGDPTDAARELAREYRALIENLLELRGAGRAIEAVRSVRHPGHLADLAGYSPDFSIEQKAEVLETLDIEQRLSRLIAWTKDVLADASVREKVRTEVNEGMEKTQRDFLLRQQLEAIKKQLGEGGDDVAAGYRGRLENAGMPDNVRAEVERELDRFERTSEQSPEHGWIRTYLDWMFEIPWNTRSDDNFDLAEARRILDEDHTGLEDVKQRIIEFLAVRKLRSERGITVLGGGSGAIITLVGPPGVGKTSLGESVARALGRKFTRISLGGIRDEADIRGHRRTYVGALPGRIVRALKEAGTKNPVIMLDEIDKVGSDWRGDPSSALLEVLDPAQNNTFRDHYLEVDLDLSEVLFIPTANVSETIPAPLLDRMELIRLDGYTEDEKVAIARDHLLRRQIEHAGLRPDEVSVTDAAILAVITDHTREAGVRNLERELGKMTSQGRDADRWWRARGPVGDHARSGARTPRQAEVRQRSGGAHGRCRRGNRSCGHRHGRRRPLHRGREFAWGRKTHPDRPARRRDEGVGADRALLRACSCGRAGDRPRGRASEHPRPCARRCGAEGRSVGRRRDDDRDGQSAHRAADAQHRGDDR